MNIIKHFPHKAWCFFIVSVIILTVPTSVSAIEQSEVLWEAPYSVGISSDADDLRERLAYEVRKIVDHPTHQHLAPFRALYGEHTIHYYWYRPADIVLTLSRAYPYLSYDLQQKTLTYLQTEMGAYPPWNDILLSSKEGMSRQPDEMTSNEVGTISDNYRKRPKLWSIYALWLYAQRTDDWDTIYTNWSNIKTYYNNNRGEADDYYSSIGGAIGMARLAYKWNQDHDPDDSIQSTAETDARNGLTAGQNFHTFGSNAESIFKWEYPASWSWSKNDLYIGFVFLNLSAEVARYMEATPTLKSLVLGDNTSDTSYVYSLERGEQFFPLWFMAQGPSWTRYFGEGAGTPPDTRGMLFGLHAWVLKDSADTLRYYLDTPDALIGDCYYIQNLVSTLESYGTEGWYDVRYETPPVEPPPPPPPPPEYQRGDLNHDETVNGSDAKMIFRQYGNTASEAAANEGAYYDAEDDDKVNSMDFGWVYVDWDG